MTLTCVFVQYHENWTKFYFDGEDAYRVYLYVPRPRGGLSSRQYVVGKTYKFVLPD